MNDDDEAGRARGRREEGDARKLDGELGRELRTCLAAECGGLSRRSARSRSTAESILKVVLAISRCSSASMMMTALSTFNHWSFKVSPSRIASRTRSAR
jgi:hypothetical protein